MDYKEQVPNPTKIAVKTEVDETPVAEMTQAQLVAEENRLVSSYPEKRGYAILEHDWHCVDGDVPVVADDNGKPVLVLTKVARKLGDDADAMPELSVDKRKQQHYRKLGLLYLASHPAVDDIRVDVIALYIVGERCARLRYLIGAYEYEL